MIYLDANAAVPLKTAAHASVAPNTSHFGNETQNA
jgi:hypothetical protein